MAETSFRCRLVTPAAALVDDQLSYASVPAWDGLFGVQPGHAPLLARLGTGALRLDYADSSKGQGGSRVFVIDGGFVRMANNQLTILAESAVAAESLTVGEAEAALKAAEALAVGGEGAARTVALEKKQRAVRAAQAKVSVARAKGGI